MICIYLLLIPLRHSSGERVPAFERVLEVSAADADKMSSMMKYYKKIGYIRAHRRLYNLVKKYYHKDKVDVYMHILCVICRYNSKYNGQ